jgi:hypothetical protein
MWKQAYYFCGANARLLKIYNYFCGFFRLHLLPLLYAVRHIYNTSTKKASPFFYCLPQPLTTSDFYKF